jgi:hypothetical protein
MHPMQARPNLSPKFYRIFKASWMWLDSRTRHGLHVFGELSVSEYAGATFENARSSKGRKAPFSERQAELQ